MPELPEVETIRLQLRPHLIGKEIKSVEALEKKQFQGSKKEILNKKIVDVKRTGKVLNIVLEEALFLNIHLKLTGQLLYAPDMKKPVFSATVSQANTDRMPAKTTRIIIYFKDGSGLFFNDLRKFGWLKVTKKRLGPKGVDVTSKDLTVKYLEKATTSSKIAIKNLLMNQEKIAGIGNIYANDALFLAKIKPTRKANSLSKKEVEKLHQAIKKAISDGLKYQGSSGADEAYVKPNGTKGEYQEHFQVYQSENEPCPRCKTAIKRIKQGGRSSFFCPKCQK